MKKENLVEVGEIYQLTEERVLYSASLNFVERYMYLWHKTEMPNLIQAIIRPPEGIWTWTIEINDTIFVASPPKEYKGSHLLCEVYSPKLRKCGYLYFRDALACRQMLFKIT